MALTTSALQIGKSALIAYQQALQLTGNNLANAGNPVYSRQTATFNPLPGANVSGIQIGTGVQVTSVKRHVLESLEARLRTAISDRDAALTRRTAADRIETLFNALGDTNLGTAITDLFNAFSELQNNPDDAATRGVVVQSAQTLSEALQKARIDLINLREDLNDDVVAFTARADQIATQIADLNVEITAAEAAGGAGQSGPLRDQRGALLQELAGLVEIKVREQPGGATNVFIGNEPLVQFGVSRGLKTTLEPIGSGLNTAVVRFADNNGNAAVQGGEIAGAIDVRDNSAQVQFDRLNTLTKAIIQEVNKRHSSGQGLSGFTSLTGAYAVDDVTAALNTAAAGLDLQPKSGTFFIDVRNDTTASTTRYQITVDLDGLNANDTTLASLAAQINATIPAGNVTATALPDGTLSLTAAAGVSFTFADDHSDVLAALGLNTFFTGEDALDIAVNTLISGSPSLIAAAGSGLAGDGSNAGSLAAAIDAPVTLLGSVTIAEYHQASVSESAVQANAAGNTLDAAEVIFSSLTAQRESLSGVNLDEETVKLIAFQRAYQGAARYLSVVDEMLQTLLSLVS